MSLTKIFRDYFGRPPQRGELVEMQMPPVQDGIVIGKIARIVYQATGNEEEFFDHTFDDEARPALVIAADGTQFYSVGGAYQFTGRGFEG